jgi:phosphoglycolate phosphatase-like HAD superfamily hydrolase
MIKNLIWDFDGTLFDTYPAFTQAFVSALARCGHPVDPICISHLARVGLVHCAAQLADRYGCAKETVMRIFQEEYSLISYEQQGPMPCALDLCRYIIGCSGCNVIVTHRSRQSTIALLRAYGVEHLFRDTITGDDDFPRKPHSGGIEAIVERNELAKEHTLVIGDRELDAIAGKLAGLRTCILGHDDRGVSATYSVSNLDELRQIILSENED